MAAVAEMVAPVDVGTPGHVGGMVTLRHASSFHSEFGTLGERVAAAMNAADERLVDPARHVWVKTPAGRQAGLLLAWVRGAEGKWWGKVAVSDAPGEASLQLVDSSLLAPASTEN